MSEPKCPYFGRCGGCTFQHLDYQLQLDNKRKTLENAIHYKDIQAFSGSEYNYRNRMDFVFHRGGVGLRRQGNWKDIVDVERCEISNERLNSLLKELRDFFKSPDHFDVIKKSGTFRYAVVRTPGDDSSISFVLNSESSRLNDAVEKIKEFSNITTANNIIVTYVPADSDVSVSDEFFVVKGKDMLAEKYLGKEFIYSVQGFFQNNTEMVEKMQKYCNDLLAKHDTKNSHLLDLYGGVGTFGIMNSVLFKGTTVVESVKQCIDAANINIKKNGAKNTEATVLDAAKLKNIELPQPLFVITDPPRSGMHPNTIAQLNRLKPRVIIYISCNVIQLGKDIPKFKEYTLKSAALFDLFPQTPHSEAVVELVLKK